MKTFFLLLCMVVIVSGCATIEMERSRAGAVKLGMKKEQVFEIMGRPENSSKWGQEERFSWQDVIIVFEDGVVVNKASFELHTRYEIQAEALIGSTPKRKVAMILPSVKDMTKDDLEFISAKNIVANILKENGYVVSEDETKIDTVVFVNFGVSEPKTETKTWSEPVYDYVTSQPQQSSTTHNVYNQYGQNLGQVQSQTNYGNPYAVNVPQPVYRGERTKSVTVTKYVRHFILEATDYEHFKKNKTTKNFWKVITISEGSSNDIRKVLPFLGVIAKQIVESDTNGKQVGFVYETDPRAKYLNDNQRQPASKGK